MSLSTARLWSRLGPAFMPFADVASPGLPMRRLLRDDPAMAGWRPGRTLRIASGLYTSQALELVRA